MNKKLKILIVDDSDTLTNQLNELIMRNNSAENKFETKTVKDGLSFVVEMRKFTPNIVFLDKELEVNTDGLESLQVVRNLVPPVAPADIVLLTADENQRTITLAELLGVKKIIFKNQSIRENVETFIDDYLRDNPQWIET